MSAKELWRHKEELNIIKSSLKALPEGDPLNHENTMKNFMKSSPKVLPEADPSNHDNTVNFLLPVKEKS